MASARRSKKNQPDLTEREIEVLKLVLQGKSNRAIAGQLGLTNDRIGKIIQNARLKLGHRLSRKEAATFAEEQGLLDPN